MGPTTKRLTLLTVLALASTACTTSLSQKPKKDRPSLIERIDAPAPVGAMSQVGNTQDLPGASPEASPAPTADTSAQPALAVYIDGAGLESLQALGFLQELEKVGVHPKRILGHGFGCWIALSWALQGSGNQAEWQSFKWSSWKYLQSSGLLSRLQLRPSRSSFNDEVRRLFPIEDLARLRVPAACPYFERTPAGHGRPQGSFVGSVADTLWTQFHVPALDGDPEAAGTAGYAGLVAGQPTPAELDIYSGPTNFRWLVLKSRNPKDREFGPAAWSAWSRARPEPNTYVGTTPEGMLWREVELAEPNRPVEDVRDFAKRRAWLLRGRTLARALLQTPEFRNFLALPEPTPKP